MELGKKISWSLMKFIAVILFFFICGSIEAQQDPELISRHRPGVLWYFTGLRPLQDADNRKYDRLIVDVTYNDWLGAVSPFENRWNSLGVNTNFMFDVRSKKNQAISFGWGFAYAYSTVATDKKFLIASDNSVSISPKLMMDNYTLNTIHSHRFYIPLELRFASKKWSRFKFIIGANVGIQPFLNQVFLTKSDGEKEYFTNVLSDRNLLSYGVHFRAGTRNLALFGSYQFNSLFKSRESVKLHPFQFGLSISLF
jgi:hypothetical protein